MIKKYVKGAISFIDVLSYLEPFLIYQDDITYKQYEVIQKFLETKTTDFKKRLAKCDKQFNIIGNRNYHEKSIQRYLLNLFSDKGDVYGVIPPYITLIWIMIVILKLLVRQNLLMV